ncbi:MAG: recombinase family protein [Bacilli bacterium]|nr:recombinase family protein [Bacilli bacterium]
MAQVEIIAANLKQNKINSVKTIIKRVCAYARVSTDSEEQLTSYSSQIKHYSEKIKSNPDWEFVGVYADEGISGTQVKNRTEFQKMIDDALNGKIDMIIAKSISRFARNTLDTLKYVRLLREHNVDVYFEKENIHTLELDSEMFLTLYSAFAQAESESTSMNVKMGLNAKMKRGEPVGNQNCYGFIWNEKTKELEINEEQAEVVRLIFDLYVKGLGGRTIAHKLNDMGITTYFDKKWSQSSINRVIRNEKYVGDLLGQKYYVTDPLSHKRSLNYGEKEQYYVKDHHKGIVSRNIWNKAQEILNKRNNNKKDNGRKHKTTYSLKYDFSSKIVCGHCNSTYVRRQGTKRKDGTAPIYWKCFQQVDEKRYCEHSVVMREDVLKNMFVELYNLIVKNKHKTKEKLLDAIKSTLKEENYQKDIDKLNVELDKLNTKLSKLVDMQLDGVIDKDIYVKKEQEIKSQITDIEEKINNLENIKNTNNNMTKKIKEIEKIVNAPTCIKEFDKETFDSIVERIIIGEDSNDSNVVRFILKTGMEYKCENNRIDTSVSFGSYKRCCKTLSCGN